MHDKKEKKNLKKEVSDTAERTDVQSFFIVPYCLLNESSYADLPIEAIVLYGLLRDRSRLSEVNKWNDEYGTYLYYTVEDACKKLRCGRDKAMSVFHTLERHKLIFHRREDRRAPNKYYVTDILTGVVNYTEPAEKKKYDVGNSVALKVGTTDCSHS